MRVCERDRVGQVVAQLELGYRPAVGDHRRQQQRALPGGIVGPGPGGRVPVRLGPAEQRVVGVGAVGARPQAAPRQHVQHPPGMFRTASAGSGAMSSHSRAVSRSEHGSGSRRATEPSRIHDRRTAQLGRVGERERPPQQRVDDGGVDQPDPGRRHAVLAQRPQRVREPRGRRRQSVDRGGRPDGGPDPQRVAQLPPGQVDRADHADRLPFSVGRHEVMHAVLDHPGQCRPTGARRRGW